MSFLRVRVAVGLAALLSAGAAFGQAAGTVDLMPDESLHGWTRIPIPPVDGLQPKMQDRKSVV